MLPFSRRMGAVSSAIARALWDTLRTPDQSSGATANWAVVERATFLLSLLNR
jgi:hypothetical protein